MNSDLRTAEGRAAVLAVCESIFARLPADPPTCECAGCSLIRDERECLTALREAVRIIEALVAHRHEDWRAQIWHSSDGIEDPEPDWIAVALAKQEAQEAKGGEA